VSDWTERKDFASILYTWCGPDLNGDYSISALAKLNGGHYQERFRSVICNRTVDAKEEIREALRCHYRLAKGESLEDHVVIIEHTVQVQYKWELQ